MALRTDAETLVAVTIMLGAGVLIGVLGQRIRNGERSLIAGYDPESIADEASVGSLVGTTVVALGGVTGGYGIGLLVVEPGLLFWLSYTGIVFVAVGIVQIRGRRDTA